MTNSTCSRNSDLSDGVEKSEASLASIMFSVRSDSLAQAALRKGYFLSLSFTARAEMLRQAAARTLGRYALECSRMTVRQSS